MRTDDWVAGVRDCGRARRLIETERRAGRLTPGAWLILSRVIDARLDVVLQDRR